MVDVVVVLDGTGCLSRLSLTGHAGYGTRGFGYRLKKIFTGKTGSPVQDNPACAAVTLVARSVARLTASRAGWTVDGKAPEPGNLSLVVERRPEDTDKWLLGVTETLMQALADIDAEYPEAISVSIEEKTNGS